MFYCNTKVKVHSLDRDTGFFDIVDYELRMSIDLIKENGFTLKKGKEETISLRNYNGRILSR